ncbi:hypothetical protein [Tabrizicola aquatica]|uniref:hypothetical protein n=1 Tax=Tabrizicola aquatica TaxID=909926 RepID=UPI0011AF94F9|nr:hypothetical protein [Tabrizicola aquatica]
MTDFNDQIASRRRALARIGALALAAYAAPALTTLSVARASGSSSSSGSSSPSPTSTPSPTSAPSPTSTASSSSSTTTPTTPTTPSTCSGPSDDDAGCGGTGEPSL